MQLKNRSTKVAVTVDPSVCTPEEAERLFPAGADIFRINFSRNSSANNLKIYEAIRAIGRKYRAFPTILADLQWSEAESDSQKEIKNLNLAVELGVDGVILSSIENPESVLKAKSIVRGRAAIVVKPESFGDATAPMAEASDGILADGRDETFFSTAAEKVTDICNRLGRPVTVSAKSLTDLSTEIGKAVCRKADAIALPTELSAGESLSTKVKELSAILESVVSDPSAMRYAKEEARLPHGSITDAVCSSAKEAAEVSRASALMLFTDSWETVLRYSRLCSRVRSVLVTDSFGLAGRSGLCGPIYATVSKKQFKAEEICQTAKIIALENGLAIAGNNIVVLNCISTDYSVTVRRL